MGEAARAVGRSATPGPRSPREVEGVYERAIAVPGAGDAPRRAPRAGSGSRPPTGAERDPRAAAALARPGAGARPRPPSDRAADRPRRRRRSSASGSPSSPRSGSGSTTSSTNIVRSDLDLGPGRDGADDAPRCSCAPSSWFSIARSALPSRPLRRRDVTSATMIGVLMSATLPARLGEPARAMVLSRRTGRMRETFPVLLGTLVSQTRAQHRRAGPARRADRLARPTSSTRAPSGSSCSASRRCCCWSRSCWRRPSSARRAPGGSRA